MHRARRATHSPHLGTDLDGENLRDGFGAEVGAGGMETFKKLLFLFSCAA